MVEINEWHGSYLLTSQRRHSICFSFRFANIFRLLPAPFITSSFFFLSMMEKGPYRPGCGPTRPAAFQSPFLFISFSYLFIFSSPPARRILPALASLTLRLTFGNYGQEKRDQMLCRRAHRTARVGREERLSNKLPRTVVLENITKRPSRKEQVKTWVSGSYKKIRFFLYGTGNGG